MPDIIGGPSTPPPVFDVLLTPGSPEQDCGVAIWFVEAAAVDIGGQVVG